MDGKGAVSREQLLESLKDEIEEALKGVAEAVNNAPLGRIISGSERQVKELMDGLRAKVLERALQMKADSVESAFSPGGQSGQGVGEQGAVDSLDIDAVRKSGTCPSTLARCGGISVVPADAAYAEFEQRGWDIGSGPTESQCKATTRRIKGRGMRREPKNAEAMMSLEALYQGGAWDKWWSTRHFIKT